jgi:hypothetical protein
VETKRFQVLGVILCLVASGGCGKKKPLATGLHITVTNVGWEKVGEATWKMIGARVDVDCALQKMVVRAEHVERSSEASVSTVCAAIRRDPGLLQPAAAPSCSEYNTGTVSVTGSWQGRRVNLRFPTCEGNPKTDPGRRWARLFGFYFQGPDPPA